MGNDLLLVVGLSAFLLILINIEVKYRNQTVHPK